MLPNILEIDPRITNTPTPALKREIDYLQKVASEQPRETVTRSPNDRIETLRIALRQIYKSDYGNKGPVDDARDKFKYLAERAIEAGYQVEIRKVQQAFADMLAVYVTSGFIGSQTGGTTVGNHTHSDWGGHFDYSKFGGRR
ncbi:MAG: hypothetical protein LBI75_05090 [Brucellaceae bacterium]|jgi:hypothetical protein|nr:hypothetical protein [Brucellaceae bacterium]